VDDGGPSSRQMIMTALVDVDRHGRNVSFQMIHECISSRRKCSVSSSWFKIEATWYLQLKDLLLNAV